MAERPSARLQQASLRQLIVERVPLILLSIASAAITIAAQKTSLASVQLFPLALRLESALIACVLCLKEGDLAVVAGSQKLQVLRVPKNAGGGGSNFARGTLF